MAEAEPLYRRALSIRERSLGKEHPDVAQSLNNLALLLHDTNRMDEAELLYRRALSIDENSFGKEHPNVATDLNNLALLLKATNRKGEAEPLMRRMAMIFIKFTSITGHQHPCLEDAMKNYAVLLQQMGYNREQVVTRLRELYLGIAEKAPGPNYPNTATFSNNPVKLNDKGTKSHGSKKKTT